MKTARISELIALLQPAWQKESELSLIQFIEKLANEAGFNGGLHHLTDDTLMYQLKMRDTKATDAIPGLKKDYEEDFKSALLRARGILKE